VISTSLVVSDAPYAIPATAWFAGITSLPFFVWMPTPEPVAYHVQSPISHHV
jgi:hypothetical protein